MDRVNRIVSQLAPNSVASTPTEVVIVSGCRTAMGGFNGKLASQSATKMGSAVIAEALRRGKVDPGQVQECIMGNVLSANLGQAPARQAALGAGLPNSVPCTTVNKVCSSGMKAITMAAAQIQLGYADTVVAGGMESMTNVPFYLPRARFGMRFGDGKVVDGLSWDGLSDAYAKTAMGNCAELCADEFSITRQEQDDYAEQSYKRAQAATQAGHFKAEIHPISLKKGTFDHDEEAAKIDFVKMRKLRTVFKKNGTVTAANASAISDGAAAVVLMSAQAAAAQGLAPMAKILSSADAAQLPEKFTTAPAIAIKLALERAQLTLEQVDLFEINEAFSVVALANQRLLGLDPAKVNVWGGAVSIGHPLGVSGCRIVVTLLHALKATGGKIGVAGICNGGGGATAMVVQLL